MKVVKKVIGYKTLTDDLMSGHGCEKWKLGEWKKHKGELKLCQNGFHASRHPLDALKFIQGNRFFIVEGKGEIIDDENKFVIREMKLVKEIKDLKKISVELAIYSAKRCLLNYEKKYPDDKRIRQAIGVAEAWLKAETPEQKEAARSAAESAARSAAWSAESAAWSAARSAAWSAAESAAWSAAESAAWSAAESAAWSAARSAAWSAESAAWSAARSAAWSAESAARSAESAARSDIKKKFKQIIKKQIREEAKK